MTRRVGKNEYSAQGSWRLSLWLTLKLSDWNWAGLNFYNHEIDSAKQLHKRNSTKAAARQISNPQTPGSRLPNAVSDGSKPRRQRWREHGGDPLTRVAGLVKRRFFWVQQKQTTADTQLNDWFFSKTTKTVKKRDQTQGQRLRSVLHLEPKVLASIMSLSLEERDALQHESKVWFTPKLSSIISYYI